MNRGKKILHKDADGNRIDKNHKIGKRKGGRRAVVAVAIGLFILVAAFCIWYVNDYYRSEVSLEEYREKEGFVQVVELEDGLFLNGSGEADALIFYPGAKVEYTAYLPLFYSLAEQGVDCFLVEMPGNLAILDVDKADEIRRAYTYDNWYLAGHSLGGAMAASYTAKHLEELAGLVLLAAYPTTSLQSENFATLSTFPVISVYGSEDGVLNQEKLIQGRSFMPVNYEELCIEGGNHAWFGNYGEQEGDKAALITREEQQEQTVNAILEMVENRRGK